MPTNVGGLAEAEPLEGYVKPSTVNAACDQMTPQPGARPPPRPSFQAALVAAPNHSFSSPAKKEISPWPSFKESARKSTSSLRLGFGRWRRADRRRREIRHAEVLRQRAGQDEAGDEPADRRRCCRTTTRSRRARCAWSSATCRRNSRDDEKTGTARDHRRGGRLRPTTTGLAINDSVAVDATTADPIWRSRARVEITIDQLAQTVQGGKRKRRRHRRRSTWTTTPSRWLLPTATNISDQTSSTQLRRAGGTVDLYNDDLEEHERRA